VSANIYVSATYQDLRKHRAAVEEAIRALGHRDVAMEHYLAEPRRPLARCLDDVRRCDLYVGIFARRYGYVPPDSTRSITEQEYLAAIKSKKDVVCFLLDEEAKWPAKFVERGKAAARLKDLLRRIRKHHLAGTFANPDELATKVSHAVVNALSLGGTPLDADRENRLMREWQHGESRMARTRARAALTNMGSPRYAAEIKRLLLDAGGRSRTANGAVAVEEIAAYLEELLALAVNSREAMPVLLDLFHSGDAHTRIFSIFQVGELGLRGKEIDPEIVRRLMQLESDKTPAVRGELAHTLGKIHHFAEVRGEVKACLRKLIKDSDDGVRERATKSLPQI
jgi:hypothetical protein